MSTKYLGELVKQDRVRHGWSQGELASELNNVQNKPLDPYTKKPKKFHRSWVAKLEKGFINRGIPLEVRRLLADVLSGDRDLYEGSPLQEEPFEDATSPDEFKKQNILPLVKKVAQMEGLNCLNLEQFTALCEAHFSLQKVGVELSTVLAT
jgi:transcriptional regulator with XRE-family HTH domain